MPNAGIAAEYRRRLLALIDQMGASVLWWVRSAYRARPPEMATDASPARELAGIVAKLRRYWERRFDRAAKELAEYFATAVGERVDATLKSILRRGGFAVPFRPTRAMNDVMAGSVEENVSLIKSIPRQHLQQVQGIVMRGVQTGRDAGQISKDLQEQLGVTKRRAALISMDQSEKTTASLNRARQIEMGIEFGIWQHSGAGREPRESHVKAGRDAVRFSLRDGWLDPAIGKRIWPGTEINCRCCWRPVIPGDL